MNKKSIIALVSCLVIFALGAYAMVYTFNNAGLTYDGTDTDLQALFEDPESFLIYQPEGVADIIVKTDLDMTKAQNVVAAVVFDYRGFDTIGESFILLCAISGAFVILRSKKKEACTEEGGTK